MLSYGYDKNSNFNFVNKKAIENDSNRGDKRSTFADAIVEL